jgi:hypothetical protein
MKDQYDEYIKSVDTYTPAYSSQNPDEVVK